MLILMKLTRALADDTEAHISDKVHISEISKSSGLTVIYGCADFFRFDMFIEIESIQKNPHKMLFKLQNII